MDFYLIFIATGVSFRIANSVEWKELMKELNPEYAKNPVNAYRVSGELLDELYDSKKSEIQKIINLSSHITVITDGFTNIRQDHLVNFFLKTQGKKSIYFKTIDTEGKPQNAAAIAEDIANIIKEIGPEKVDNVVTDNCNVMQAAWEILRQEYDQLNCYGCTAHMLNLLIQDIVKSNDDFEKLCEENEIIVKYINNHHATNRLFRDNMQAEGVGQKLTLRVKSRWYSVFNSLNNTMTAKSLLIMMVNDHKQVFDNINPRAKSMDVVRLIKCENFWQRLQGNIRKIELPTKLIGRVESDDSTIEIVQQTFIELLDFYIASNDLRAQKLVLDRWNKIACTVIRAAHMLNHVQAMDSKYLPGEDVKCLEALSKQAIEFGGEIFEKQVISEIQVFHRNMRELDEIHKENYRRISSSSFWVMHGHLKFPSLYKLSDFLFGAASSAASERGWSIVGFVHSRLRNRLVNEKVDKIQFLMFNKMLQDAILDFLFD